MYMYTYHIVMIIFDVILYNACMIDLMYSHINICTDLKSPCHKAKTSTMCPSESPRTPCHRKWHRLRRRSARLGWSCTLP